jgi:hypothetical protein
MHLDTVNCCQNDLISLSKRFRYVGGQQDINLTIDPRLRDCADKLAILLSFGHDPILPFSTLQPLNQKPLPTIALFGGIVNAKTTPPGVESRNIICIVSLVSPT